MALPAVVLFLLYAAFPFVFEAVEVTAESVRLLVLGRRVVAAGAVLAAAGTGYALLGGDGTAARSPGLVFAGFLLASLVGVGLGALVVWLAGPEGTRIGPAWQLLGNALTTEGLAAGFAGLAGAAVADLRAE